MNEPCIRPEELDGLEGLDAEHPRRRHARDCPRCSSLVISRHSFLGVLHRTETELEPTTADVELASRRLSTALEREIYGSRELLQPTESAPIRWWRAIAGSQLPSPAWSLAMLLIVFGGVVVSQLPSFQGTREATLRNDVPADELPQLDAPEVLAEGGVRLSWRASSEATAYEVRLYSAELDELWRSGPITASHLVLMRAKLPDSVEGGQPLLWRVDALRNGDLINSSAVGSFRAP